MTTDYERAFAFQTWVMEQTSTRTERLPWGTAFFHDGFPLRYDANMAIVDGPLSGASADDVVALLDATYDGFRHREIELASAADADSIAMGMAEHGYAVERMVVMAHRRDPDRRPDLRAVEELEFGEMEPFFTQVNLREAEGREPGIAQMLSSFRRVLVDGVAARFFAQRIEGKLAGSCELYMHGDVAQIEDVNTLEEYRGRGVARNVVLGALAEAHSAGATLVFLFADAQDWPRHLYGRLGFDEIGRSGLFTRRPEGSETHGNGE